MLFTHGQHMDLIYWDRVSDGVPWRGLNNWLLR